MMSLVTDLSNLAHFSWCFLFSSQIYIFVLNGNSSAIQIQIRESQVENGSNRETRMKFKYCPSYLFPCTYFSRKWVATNS